MQATALPWADDTQPAVPLNPYSGQWNWGAFFWQWIWLFAHNRAGLAVTVFLTSAIPFVSIGWAIWLGVKGNDLATEKRVFTSRQQYVAVQNAWRNWGFGVIGAIFVLAFIVSMAGYTSH